MITAIYYVLMLNILIWIQFYKYFWIDIIYDLSLRTLWEHINGHLNPDLLICYKKWNKKNKLIKKIIFFTHEIKFSFIVPPLLSEAHAQMAV